MLSIALHNTKGGVGKTTNTVNVAGALAERGHDVLVVDLDPQHYLTTTLGFREPYRTVPGDLADALRDPFGMDRDTYVRDHPEFDLVPGDESLQEVVRSVIRSEGPEFGLVGRFLEAADDGRYDFVVVDTPPMQNAFTDVVTVDCGDMFVPMAVSESSVYSIRSLVDHVVQLEQTTGGGIRIRAVLLSDVNYPLDNEQKRVSEWVQDNFGDQCPVYEIRHRAAIQRSLNAHGSVFGPHAESTDMADVYLDIATQIEGLRQEARATAGDA